MNIAEVTTRGPIMENLAEVIVSDDFQTETFFIDYADLEKAQSAGAPIPAFGHRDVLELIYNNGGSITVNILQAAAANEVTVNLDGDPVSGEVLRSVFNGPKP